MTHTVSVHATQEVPQAVVRCRRGGTVTTLREIYLQKTALNSGTVTNNGIKMTDKMVTGNDMEKMGKDKTAVKGRDKTAEKRGAETEKEVKVRVERGGETAAMTHAAGGEMERKSEEAVAERGEVMRELVVNVEVEVEGEKVVSMLELLRAVVNTCGKVIGCRAKGSNRWELTMNNPKGKERLLDGFRVGDNRVTASEVTRDQRIVSFLNLPLYITDNQIVGKTSDVGG